METSSSNKWWYYLGTLAIELVTGVFRLLFTVPLVMLILIVVEYVLGRLGIQLFDVYRSYSDLQYSQQLLWFIIIAAAVLAYANIIASLIAAAGFGGGSLMTRFVLGARKPSTRERETILQVFEQLVEGADFPINSYSKLYVIDSILEFANLIGTTLYVSSASFRGNNLQALIAHEFGHLNNGDGSLILALRRLVFPPFSLFIGGIRDFSTNRPAYRPGVKEFDAVQIFYSMINNIIFFTLAFIGGGIGVWVMSWAWASYFRARDYLADSFAAGLGYRDLLLSYLELNIYFDTSIPYMLGWHPAAELRIDALQHPDLYGLPVYDDVPAAAVAAAAFAPLSDVEPTGERAAGISQVGDQKPPSNQTLRNIVTAAIIIFALYALFSAWPSIQAQVGELMQSPSPTSPAQPDEPSDPGQEAAPIEEATELPAPTATIEAVVLEPTPEPYDCWTIVSASRALTPHGSGEVCWFKLDDGDIAVVEFSGKAQITYRTTSGGNDVYFYIAEPGDSLTDVVGAIIRPMPFVEATYGGLEEVKNFEVDYHSPGGQWVACLWDANNDQALTAECEKEAVVEPTLEPVEEPILDSLIGADVLAQIQKLGYATADDFAEAWSLRIGPEKANGEVDPGEIATCPGEVNGCVRITRETNANGAVEWPFFARNPNTCEHNGYRRVPGEGAQTGVPANFEGFLEGITIRRCQ